MRGSSHLARWSLGLAVLLLTGCTEASPEEATDAEVTAAFTFSDIVGTSPAADVAGADAPPPDGFGSLDDGTSAAELVVWPVDVLQPPQDAGPAPLCDGAGGVACPCTGPGECAVGLECAAAGPDQLCAPPCAAGCPAGWICAPGAGHPTPLCLPAHLKLCAPCFEDSDCVEQGAQCLDRGPSGRFCGSPCGSAGCPAGYSCVAGQCVPGSAGECPCSIQAVIEGASTECQVTNAFGSCPGLRWCTEQGLTACDGAPATAELCNGLDDDCDGVTDEETSTCTTYYADVDNDGYGVLGDSKCLCAPQAPYTTVKPGDCDDSTGAASPEGAEICDGLDNDCNGATDGLSRPCSSACGQGTETCVGGTWQGCAGGSQACDPSQPCCQASGCGFEPASKKCSAAPIATREVCQGACGGAAITENQWTYCSGSSAGCAGGAQWEAGGLAASCGAAQLCTQVGSSAVCQSCPGGCANGSCQSQPAHIVCIDPGYGGGDGGPVGSGTQGSVVTWSVAQHLKAWLDADTADASGGGSWSVVLTRGQGEGPTNATRAATCNMAGADRLVAIFVNACCGGDGSETYHAVGASAASVQFTNQVHTQLLDHGGLDDRGVKSGSYTIIVNASMPAAMPFLGFIDNPSDGAQLGSNAWRQEVAKGLLHALQLSLGYSEHTP